MEEKSYGIRLTSPKTADGHGDTFSAFSLALLVGHELAGKKPVEVGGSLYGDDEEDPYQRAVREFREEQAERAGAARVPREPTQPQRRMGRDTPSVSEVWKMMTHNRKEIDDDREHGTTDAGRPREGRGAAQARRARCGPGQSRKAAQAREDKTFHQRHGDKSKFIMIGNLSGSHLGQVQEFACANGARVLCF